jgi:type I restriction enzyme, S subunit
MRKKTIPLSEYITLQRGFDLPERVRKPGNIPVVASTKIVGYHAKKKVKGPGVVIGRSGSIGGGQYIGGDFWPLNTTLWVKDFKDHYPRFIYYLLKSIDFTKFNVGAGVPTLNRNHLVSILVLNYSDNEENKISEILANYDDLIENNRRRIELLEESARLLYQEWFVQFRFPGYEKIKITDGVPEGWKHTNAFEVMDVLSGGTPKTKIAEYWNGDIPFFTPKDTTNTPYVLTTEKTLTKEGLLKCNSKLYPKNTLFITARGTVGKLNLAQTSMAMNQSCYALKPKDPINHFFLYNSLKASIAQFKSKASGAVFDAIIVDTFKLIPFLIPKSKLINDYTEQIKPSFEQIDNLIKQNQKLSQARNLLLPRLMNGDIEV